MASQSTINLIEKRAYGTNFAKSLTAILVQRQGQRALLLLLSDAAQASL
jgi:hypothetical protein